MRWIEARRRFHPFSPYSTRLLASKRKNGFLCACLALALLAGPAAANAQQAPPSPPAPASPTPPASPVPRAPAHPEPRFVVVIDPAHGGTDSGARLSNQVQEKDLVLTLAASLRSMLNAHGIPVVSIRESDITLSAVRRAEMANHVMAAACVTLHATASGVGVHLFTSSLTAIQLETPMAGFLPWDNAQGAYIAQSQRLSSEIDSAMTHVGIPVILGRTALEPLDSFACPAVAVELAPLERSGSAAPLSDPAYQNQVISALATSLEEWKKDWRQKP